MFRSVSHKNIISSIKAKILHKDVSMVRQDEPQDFEEYLKRTNTDFLAFTQASVFESTSQASTAQKIKGREYSPTMKSKKSIKSNESSPYHMADQKSFIDQNQASVYKTDHKGNLKAPNSKKSPYKLFSQQEGAFAFRSETELVQPYYPLLFKEHDLAYQLEAEELKSKQSKKKGEAMMLAMRHMLKKSVIEMQEKEKIALNSTSAATLNAQAKILSTMNNVDKQKGVIYEAPIKMYPLNKVIYRDDLKLPFELLCDVPRTIKKSLEALNMSKILGESGSDDGFGMQGLSQVFATDGKKGGSFSTEDRKSNELFKFLKYNESGFNNLVVYLFWIIISDWFNDDHISFTQDFIRQVREALREQYRKIYFKYLLRLRHQVMDNIIDILPFFLAEIIRNLIQTKLRNHDLPLQLNKTFLLLIGSIFRELYGFDTSEISLAHQKKKYIKSFAERIKTHVKSKRKPQEPSPDKNAGSGSNPKNSIYNVTFKTPRDPHHNNRDFSKEIQSDLVNEMINEWGKLGSVEAKMLISDQINRLSGTPSPSQIISTDTKLQLANEMMTGKRRKGLKMHWSHTLDISGNNSRKKLAGKSTFYKPYHPFIVDQKQEVRKAYVASKSLVISPTSNVDSRRSQSLQLKKLRFGNEKHYENYREDVQNIFYIEMPSASQGEVHEPIQKANKNSSVVFSLSQCRKPGSQMSANISSKDETQKVNHFTKQKIKMKQYEPTPKNVALENLKKRIETSQKKQELSETITRQSIDSSITLNLQDKKHTGSHKLLHFDLQHVSPIIRGKFPTQLQMNFNPNRKQKNIAIQKEPDLDRVEMYKILQYELKQELKEQHEKEERFWAVSSVMKMNKGLSASSLQLPELAEKTVATAINRQFNKFVGSRHQKTRNEKSSGKRTVLSKQLQSSMKIKNPSKQLLSCKTDAEESVSGPVENTRNVRFVQDDEHQKLTEPILIKADTADLQSRSFSSKRKSTQKNSPSTQTPKNDGNQELLIEQQDFGSMKSSIERSVSHTEQRTVENNQTRINLKILSEAEDLTNMSFGANSKTQVASTTMRSGKYVEKNLYDHKLMDNVKKSLKVVRKNSNSVDEQGENSRPKTNKLPQLSGQSDSLNENVTKQAKPLSKSQSQATLKPNQSLPPLSTSQLQDGTQKLENRQKDIKPIAGIRPKVVKFEFDENKGKSKNLDVEMLAPFTEEDAGRQLMRKTSKILSKTKYILSVDGSMHAPLHKQLIDYKNGLQKKPDDSEKFLQQEMIRKKLKNMLPRDLQKPERDQAFKSPPPLDYLANKHTYSSMKKISNKKSRKQFIFDDFDQDQKKKEAAKAQNKKTVIASENSSTVTTAVYDSKRSQSQSVLSKSQGQQDTISMAQLSQRESVEEKGLKTYHIYKGSHFFRGQDGYNTGQMGLPPRPSGRQQDSKMLHTMKTPHFVGHSENGDKTKTEMESERAMIWSEDEKTDEEQRYKTEQFFRRNQQLNENDDRADIRDGIAETKGKKLRVNMVHSRRKQMPKEHNTKIFRMLKDMRSYMSRENERKQAVAIQNKKEMEIMESEDEKERCDEDQEDFVARPNPLELQSKKPKKTPKTQGNTDLNKLSNQLSSNFRQQFKKIRTSMREIQLFDKKTHRKKVYNE